MLSYEYYMKEEPGAGCAVPEGEAAAVGQAEVPHQVHHRGQ